MSFISTLIRENAQRWATAKFDDTRMGVARAVAKRLCAPKAKMIYQKISVLCGGKIPWWVIAVIHQRECSQSWLRSIAQGDRWNRVSVNEPRGRGPFRSFEAAAVDALMKCPPKAAKWRDWTPGGTLTILELYNGTGYERYHHEASPYIWSGSNQYERGKYVADGRFDAHAVDQQLGCALLIHAMNEIDPSVAFHPLPLLPKKVTPKKVSASGGAAIAAGTAAHAAGLSPFAIAAIVVVAAVVVYFIVHQMEKK